MYIPLVKLKTRTLLILRVCGITLLMKDVQRWYEYIYYTIRNIN